MGGLSVGTDETLADQHRCRLAISASLSLPRWRWRAEAERQDDRQE